MNLVVLTSSNSWYLRDLRRAALPHQRIHCVEHRRLQARLGSAHRDSNAAGRNHPAGEESAASWRFRADGFSLDDVDAVLVRTMEVGSLEQVVFRMDVLGQLALAGRVVVNAPKAIEAAVDKYLSAELCCRAGLRVPETIVCQTVDDAIDAFEMLQQDVVMKPIFGGEGRGICRVTDKDVAIRAFKMMVQLGAIPYLQRFIEHEGFDLRLFVLGNQVFGMRRTNQLDWRTNVSRGATTEAVVVDERLAEVAQRAAASVGAEMAGIDLLTGRDGQEYILEVNAVPGWKALASTLKVDIAARVLNYLEDRIAG